jgi:hypothetical protein
MTVDRALFRLYRALSTIHGMSIQACSGGAENNLRPILSPATHTPR